LGEFVPRLPTENEAMAIKSRAVFIRDPEVIRSMVLAGMRIESGAPVLPRAIPEVVGDWAEPETARPEVIYADLKHYVLWRSAL
jgi:hypothetical protein